MNYLREIWHNQGILEAPNILLEMLTQIFLDRLRHHSDILENCINCSMTMDFLFGEFMLRLSFTTFSVLFCLPNINLQSI